MRCGTWRYSSWKGFETAADARSWLADRYGVEYTLGGVYSPLESIKEW